MLANVFEEAPEHVDVTSPEEPWRPERVPTGTELVTDPDAVVVHILAAPTAEELEADLTAAEAELGAGAAGAEAAAEAAAPSEGEQPPAAEAGEGAPVEGSADTAGE